ncbi:hypothetical protein AZH53_07345 [Methanomicrobiaceae archaeon CYW5]|uniref:hypothetical protein n=1 Tax=Methanovulcanius yangii TaxID=1789227 RepID=UPI0029CA9FD9|nr:hypothetical protein [Methanovulcanius yangii]MBT8508218.1 hypothetical protein [Methanovulcanius yangii]
MAIEYLIHRECPVKEALPIGNIVTRIKLMTSARAIMQHPPQEGASEEEMRATPFIYVLYGPDGEERSTRFTVGQALDLGDELARLGKGCKKCPIAGTGPFRCYGSISYPISASAEQWLCSLCTAAIEKGGTNASVVERIPRIGLTGAAFEAMRKEGRGTYFESREAATATIRQNMFTRETITSSQLLELFFGTSPLEGRHIMLLLILAGADPTGEPPDANHSLPPPPEDNDSRVGEFIEFFERLSSAFLLDVSVGVDY